MAKAKDNLLSDVITRYTDKSADARRVYLRVEQQSFCVCDHAESDDHAEWFRGQLGKAIVKIIEAQ